MASARLPPLDLRPTPSATPIEATTFWPKPPETIEETGLIAPVSRTT